MTLSVSYTGQLAEAAGTAEEKLEVQPDEKLSSIIVALTKRHGEKFSELLCDENGGIRSTVLVVIDGAQVTGEKNAITLDKANTLMLMTPIAGG